MDFYGRDQQVLMSIVRAHLRAGNWTEAREVGEFLRRNQGREASQTSEGDPTVW